MVTDKLMLYHHEAIDFLSKLEDGQYQTWRYIASHQQLVIAFQSKQYGLTTGYPGIYILFTGVDFMSLLPWWEGGPLLLQKNEVRDQVIEAIGIERKYCMLFHAQAEHFLIQIAAGSVRVSNNYNYFELEGASSA